MSPRLGSGKLPVNLLQEGNYVLIDSSDDVKALRNIGIIALMLTGVMAVLIVASVLIS